MGNGTIVIPAMVTTAKGWRSSFFYKKPADTIFTLVPEVGHLANECSVVEIESGKITLFGRVDTTPAGQRFVATFDFSKNMWFEDNRNKTFNLFTNCQCSIKKITHSGNTLYIKSAIDVRQFAGTRRKNQTIWVSKDAISWTRVLLVNPNITMGYGVIEYYNNKLVYIFEDINSSIKFVDLTKVLPKILEDSTILNFTYEEILHGSLFATKGWVF